MAHQGFPKIERCHFRVRLVMQQPVEGMVEGLYLTPVFTIAVHMKRKARHRLGENTDTGIHSSHLQRSALIHRFAAGGTAKEKSKAAAAQGILRPAQFLRLIPRMEKTAENTHSSKSPLSS